MSAARRWWCVGIGVALLVATPMVVRAVGVPDENVGAIALLHRIQRSNEVPFSGYVESAGTMVLPDDKDLSSLSNLLGQRSQLRVWWIGSDTWRVATLRTTGETDLIHGGGQSARWVYESKHVTLSPDVPVRLPNSFDVLPNVLARRVLSGAQVDEVSRLPAIRVAGRDALGLRLTPADKQSSIGHVDVFADATSGIPLKVALYGRGAVDPALSTSFKDVSVKRPGVDDLRFRPPPHSRVRYDDTIDLASAANRYADRTPPVTLAGLDPRGQPGLGSVGVYGRGPTVLVAIPIWDRIAHDLRDEIEKQPGSRQLPSGLMVDSGPLHLLLTDPGVEDDSWLLAGTVTPAALVDAAKNLSAHPPAHR